MASVNFSPKENLRYSRHLLLPEVGLEGQSKLKEAKILIVGVGGLGCPVALYLAASGIGTIGLADSDTVSLSNLQRQVLYQTEDVNQDKTQVAQRKIQALNPEIQINIHPRVCLDNAEEILSSYDIVIDGTDNFSSRYLLNDACVLSKKAYVYGSIFRFEGQASVFQTPEGPCYRCLYPSPPSSAAIPNCAESGVLGILPGMIAMIQATEAIKIVLGEGKTLHGRLLLYDALAMNFQEIKLLKDTSCPVCGNYPTITDLQESPLTCTNQSEKIPEIHPRELKENPDIFFVDIRDTDEWLQGALPEAKLLSLGEFWNRWMEIPWKREIVIYCQSGKRSQRAVKFLQGKGYENVKSLSGGYLAWLEENHG